MHFPSRLDGCITGKIGRFDHLLSIKILTLCCTHYQGEQCFIGCLVCNYKVCLWSVQCQGVLVQEDHDQPWTRFIICVNVLFPAEYNPLGDY